MSGQMLTTEEVAESLRVDAYTVRQWLNTDLLRGCKIGGRWRIEPADLQAFKDAGENRPPTRRRRRRAA